MMVPANCLVLECGGNYDFPIFAQNSGVLNEVKALTFLGDDGPFIEVCLQTSVSFLHICNFSNCERVYFIVLAMVCKHLVDQFLAFGFAVSDGYAIQLHPAFCHCHLVLPHVLRKGGGDRQTGR